MEEMCGLFKNPRTYSMAINLDGTFGTVIQDSSCTDDFGGNVIMALDGKHRPLFDGFRQSSHHKNSQIQ